MNKVLIEVISPLPQSLGLCTSCEFMLGQAKMDQIEQERGTEEYPPEWMEDFKQLSAFVFEIADQYGDSVEIRLYDPHSFQGMVKSIRYGVRRYPTFVVEGKKVAGLDRQKIRMIIEDTGVVQRIVNG